MNTSHYNIENYTTEDDNTLMYLYGAMTLFAALSFIINKTAKFYEEIEEDFEETEKDEEIHDVNDEISESSMALINYIPRTVANYIPRTVDNYIPRTVDNYIPRTVDNYIPRTVDNNFSSSPESNYTIQEKDTTQNIINHYHQHLQQLYSCISTKLSTIVLKQDDIVNTSPIIAKKNFFILTFEEILNSFARKNHDSLSTLANTIKTMNISDTINEFHESIIERAQQTSLQRLFYTFTTAKINHTHEYQVINDETYVQAISELKQSLNDFVNNLTLQDYCLKAIQILSTLSGSNNTKTEEDSLLLDTIEQIQLRISNLEFILVHDKDSQKDIIPMYAATICRLIDINTEKLQNESVNLVSINILKEKLNTLIPETLVTHKDQVTSETTNTDPSLASKLVSHITSFFHPAPLIPQEEAEARKEIKSKLQEQETTGKMEI